MVNEMVKAVDDNVTKIVGDADFAREAKERVRAAFEPIVEVMNEATRRGLMLNFMIARDQFGRAFVQTIDVVRYL